MRQPVERRLSMRKTTVYVLVILTILLLAGTAGCAVNPGDTRVTVERVIDGDTFKIAGSSEKVRLIGVDTPESVKPGEPPEPYGKEAAAFSKKLLAGKKVKLVYDMQERDKYGRLLAYVYLEDDTFVNALLVKEGYAQVLTVPPNVAHAEEFLQLEREARSAKRGLWGLEPGK